MSEEEAPEREAPAPRRKRRKRRRAAPETAAEPPRAPRERGSSRWLIPFTGILPWFLWKKVASAPAEPEDDGGPAFARGWPRDPELDALVAAFEAGDYARVRAKAPELARSTESDAVRRAARELARRLDPDPAAVYMLMAAAALLVFLAGWYWLHPHTP
jgi:hypothetical protein